MDVSEADDVLRDVVMAQLRPVSYKWLARRLGVSSNDAKKAMERFARAQHDTVDTLWLIAGWTKSSPRMHSFKVVPEAGREPARAALEEVTSEHVYSVQPRGAGNCAHEAWSEEHMQSLDLFAQATGNAFHKNECSNVRCNQVRWDPSTSSRSGGAKANAVDKEEEGPSKPSGGVQPKPGARKASTGLMTSGVGGTKNVSTERAAAAAHRGDMAVKPPGAVQTEVKAETKKASAVDGAGSKQEPVSGLKKGEQQQNASSKKKAQASMGGMARMVSMFAKAPPPKPAGKNGNEPKASDPSGSGGESASDDDDDESLTLSRRKCRLRKKPERRHLLDDDALEAAAAAAAEEEEDAHDALDANDAMDKGVGGDAALVGGAPGNASEATADDMDIDSSKENQDGVTVTKKRRKVERTTINERGEEVTEVVWEEYEEKAESVPAPTQQDAPPPPPARSKKSSTPKTTTTALGGKPKASSKSGAPKARSIMSFFAKAA